MAAKSDKVIITCAVTGSIHTPTMSEALPITPDQIAEQAIAAAEAGAAILHLHARNPQDGRPTGDPAVFMQFLPRIKQATDAVVNITTGGSPTMTVDERLAGVMKFSPEMCSLNMGSMNFALYPMVAKYKTWKHDWEKPYLLGTDQIIFRNTFADIEKISKLMGEGHGTKFEHECYDVGHLYNLAHCVDKGWFKPPIFLQLIFGILGGIGRVEGPIIGTVVFFVLRQTLADLGSLYLLMLGAVAIAVMLFAPKGIWGFLAERFGWQLLPLERRLRFAADARTT